MIGNIGEQQSCSLDQGCTVNVEDICNLREWRNLNEWVSNMHQNSKYLLMMEVQRLEHIFVFSHPIH